MGNTVTNQNQRPDDNSSKPIGIKEDYAKEKSLLNSFATERLNLDFYDSGSENNFTDFSIDNRTYLGIWDSGFYRHSLDVTILLSIAYIIVLIIGVIGNSLVVIVVSRVPRMKSVTNLFILNLAVADLLVVLFCLMPTLLSNVFVPWVLGWAMCKTVPYIQGVSVCASVYSLVAVSFDRCSAIWFPLAGGFTRSKARLIILGIWCVACMLAVPWALYFDLQPDADQPELQYCVETWPVYLDKDVYFLIGNLALCYLFPLGSISVCYILIWIRVVHRNVPTDSAAALQEHHNKAKIGVLKMLIVVVCVFLLSWLPLYIFFTRVKLGNLAPWEEKFSSIGVPLAQWLGSSNSCINPILYAFLNVKFRRAFMSLLPPCCRPKTFCNVQITKLSLIQRPNTSVYNYNVTTSGL